MGPRIGGEVCRRGTDPMKRVVTGVNSAVAAGQPKKPRVRLQRINCDLAKPYPPDGQGYSGGAGAGARGSGPSNGAVTLLGRGEDLEQQSQQPQRHV